MMSFDFWNDLWTLLNNELKQTVSHDECLFNWNFNKFLFCFAQSWRWYRMRCLTTYRIIMCCFSFELQAKWFLMYNIVDYFQYQYITRLNLSFELIFLSFRFNIFFHGREKYFSCILHAKNFTAFFYTVKIFTVSCEVKFWSPQIFTTF